MEFMTVIQVKDDGGGSDQEVRKAQMLDIL